MVSGTGASLMNAIHWDPGDESRTKYDLIIIGGGIYGVMLAYEASIQGLYPLIIEKNDFGGATSANSMRILHGGFRYLQHLNLPRFYVSVQERGWFLKNFTSLTQSLPFLMPLHGLGLKKPGLFRIALSIDALLRRFAGRHLGGGEKVFNGFTITANQVKKVFPAVRRKGLKAGGIWFDAVVTDSRYLLMEILKRACDKGAVALHRMRAEKLHVSSKKVAGIACRDLVTGKPYTFESRVVINAAGPWCRGLAKTLCGVDFPDLFKPSLAWNLLLNRTPPSHYGLAVSSEKPGAQTLFLVPCRDGLLAGTGHAPWNGSPEKPSPNRPQILQFLDELNTAVPDLKLIESDIRQVYAGLLPAKRDGECELRERPIIIDHGKSGGPAGFFSVSGVKFTTARQVAEQTLRHSFKAL
jgi:glycerol-3-phosphate dehydrogenase